MLNHSWLKSAIGVAMLFNTAIPLHAAESGLRPQTIQPAIEQATKTIDTIAFGLPPSEQKHDLKTVRSDVVLGGLNQAARRLLPTENPSWVGGTVEWTMAVDPKAQNYLTVKFWGSDKGANSGRLVLYANNLQVGYWRESDYDVLSQCDEDPLAPGRFVYVTMLLPPRLTEGNNSLRLKIASLGRMWPYGQNWEQFQKPLIEPTRGIYQAYTHTTPRFVPEPTEPQGAMPATKIRTTPGPEIIAQTKDTVINRLNRYQTTTASPGKPSAISAELSLLAEAYRTSWTPTFQNPLVIDQILRDGDALAEAFAKDPKFLEQDWSGAGPLGKAIALTWPALQTQLEANLTVGALETTRRLAWAKLLRSSIDYWRTHRRSFTNQSMIVDLGIYSANLGLRLIAPDRALPEAKALRYLHESAGVEPWLGSDASIDSVAPEMDTPERGVLKPYGDHYRLISRKGISRELGYVASYGETILSFVRDMVELSGDAKLREQLRIMQTSRLFFRYPGVDGEGYRCMKLASEIDNRTAHYPLSGSAYNAPNIRESRWMEIPALLSNDPVAVGAAQQSVADGQYFAYIQTRLKDPNTLGMMRNVDEWNTVSKLPPSSYRIPMTTGQPDIAFADEENAVLAIKHLDTNLFINFYYRAERAVNRVARIFEQTPTITRLATVRTEVEIIDSGKFYERPDWIVAIRQRCGHTLPPGETVHQAWAGERMPIAKRPDDATAPAYGEWGPFVGKAAFYSLRYGDYLIGMNTTEDRPYALHTPAGQTQAKDLISGKMMALGRDITVGPLSTVVLYLGESASMPTKK